MPIARRSLVLCGSVFAVNLIAACAYKKGATGINDVNFAANGGSWAGRISLKIQSNPPQAFFAGFELKGQAGAGELILTNPLGGILAVIRWSATSATLESSQEPKRFASLDELLAQTTGAAIPIVALFDWLGGKQTNLDGWDADLSRQSEGRIQAARLSPEPQAQLQLILDK